jgi:hypothetical protein
MEKLLNSMLRDIPRSASDLLISPTLQVFAIRIDGSKAVCINVNTVRDLSSSLAVFDPRDKNHTLRHRFFTHP